MIASVAASGAPLDPSGAEARGLLRRELLNAEYHRDDVWSRFTDWLLSVLLGGVRAASGTSGLAFFFSMILFLALVLALVFVATRVRGSATRRGRAGAAVLTEPEIGRAHV